MIDTGCQVTILSTTVFERMCAVDPTVRSDLRPCCRRLVSADSSPLMEQLELAIVFPGLCCDMLFVVANIGSDGLLGTEALQSYLPHQLDLRTGQLWADGWSTLQLHQQRLTPELDGFLTTSVVIPPDSETVAKFLGVGYQTKRLCFGRALQVFNGGVRRRGGPYASGRLVMFVNSGSVLIVNLNAEVVVLQSCTCIVPVAAISVALEDPGFPKDRKCIYYVETEFEKINSFIHSFTGCSAGILGGNGRRLSPVVG